MADYTKLNITEIEDAAPGFGLAPQLEARFGRRPLGAERSGVTYFRLAPGARQPFGHRHREQEETYVVLAGSGRAKIGDGFVDLSARDVLRVAPDVWRCIGAGDDGLELLAFGAGEFGDSERDEAFWPPEA